MSTQSHGTLPNLHVRAIRRVAVIGRRDLGLPVCEALASTRLPIALDFFVVDGCVAEAVPLRGNGVRCIGGFGEGDRIDRFDLTARYDAVVYGFDMRDAPRLMRTYVHSAGPTADDRSVLSVCPNEFTLDGVQRRRVDGRFVSADTVASRVAAFLGASAHGPRGWSAADPVSWIETQYPDAVIVNGECATEASPLNVSQAASVHISTAA